MAEYKDISDFVEAGLLDREGLLELTDCAQTWVEREIDRAGSINKGARRDDIVKEMIPDLARLDNFSFSQAKGRLGNIGYPKRDVDALVKAHRQCAEAGESNENEELLTGLKADFRKFFPAQDWYRDEMYLGTMVPVVKYTDKGKEIAEVPYLITSRHDAFPLDRQSLYRRGLSADTSKVGGFMCPWSYTGEFGIENWIAGNVGEVDPVKIYDQVWTLFAEHCWYPDEDYYDLFSLFSIASYWTALFDSVPYLYLNATKEAGKSLTMDILASICFNANKTESPSPATLHRLPECTRGVMLLDEQRKLARQFNDENDAIFAVLKSGYKSSGSAMLMVGDATSMQVAHFSTFCMKVIANTTKLDSELASRVITLNLRRYRGSDLKQFLPSLMRKELIKLRDKLYVMSMTHAERAAALYKKWHPLSSHGLTARDNEVWVAIFIVAQWMDELSPEKELLKKMVELAKRHKIERERKAAEEDTESLLLQTLWDFITHEDPAPSRVLEYTSGDFGWITGHHYFVEDMIFFLRNAEGWEWTENKITDSGLARRISGDLKKLGLLDNEKEKERYVRCARNGVDVKNPKSGKRRVYNLEPHQIMKIAEQRGTPLDIGDTDIDKLDDRAYPENVTSGKGQNDLFS